MNAQQVSSLTRGAPIVIRKNGEVYDATFLSVLAGNFVLSKRVRKLTVVPFADAAHPPQSTTPEAS